jgi:hypothetical protein
MRILFLLCSFLVLQSVPAFAQGEMPPCDGHIAIVRVSEVKPGAMERFTAAVEAHRAWYRKNGVKDNEIVASRVIVKDEKTGKMKYSDTEVITYHINPPSDNRKLPRDDDAWKAYVKMYRDSSTLKASYVTCRPKAR